MQHQKLYEITVNSVQTDQEGQPVTSEKLYGCYPFYVDIKEVRKNLSSLLNEEN